MHERISSIGTSSISRSRATYRRGGCQLSSFVITGILERLYRCVLHWTGLRTGAYLLLVSVPPVSSLLQWFYFSLWSAFLLNLMPDWPPVSNTALTDGTELLLTALSEASWIVGLLQWKIVFNSESLFCLVQNGPVVTWFACIGLREPSKWSLECARAFLEAFLDLL